MFLSEYVGVYLQEEIRAEGLVRNIENFSRFLHVASSCNCEQVNFTNVANDAQVPVRTVREYFQLLEDTLIGQQLEPFKGTIKRKPVSTAKFYFFDVGVANCLSNINSISNHNLGKVFEHLIFLEIKTYIDYKNRNSILNYWRSQSKFEVDFLINENIAVEAKAKKKCFK